ncbi:PREDICTED: uncharacterized protein LOC109238188 [Nicotiana attenuata]|uniref:uncharacterized protein LOC109238188 n=1 Tax=Nicotiana attenuata TaxID=49451 RepID=UPI000904AADF|nr:PREDICTED: uncharacterized protein LOC109238188 [Nicotiana attenuata]
MADKFVTAHVGAKKDETRVNDIFAIKQYLGDGLRDFLDRFTRVRITLPNISERIAVTTFQNGLSREGSRATRKLLSRLMKYPPTTRDEIHNAYCAEVEADNGDLNRTTRRLISVQAEPRKERKVYALEKLGTNVKWLPKMRSDPSTRKSDTFYEFHQERDHKIEECIAIRQEVVNKLQQGHLKELLSDKGRNIFARGRERQGPLKPPLLSRTMYMIISVDNDSSINGIKFTATHKLNRSITHKRYDRLEESIIFDESDTDGLTFPHNDAFVITLRISDTDFKCIMVNDGSGA